MGGQLGNQPFGVGDLLHQAFMGELAQGGTHRPAADAELLGKAGFDQPVAGREAAAQDLLAQHVGRATIERPARHREIDLPRHRRQRLAPAFPSQRGSHPWRLAVKDRWLTINRLFLPWCREPHPGRELAAGAGLPHRFEQRAGGVSHLFLHGLIGVELEMAAGVGSPIADVPVESGLRPGLAEMHEGQPVADAAPHVLGAFDVAMNHHREQAAFEMARGVSSMSLCWALRSRAGGGSKPGCVHVGIGRGRGSAALPWHG